MVKHDIEIVDYRYYDNIPMTSGDVFEIRKNNIVIKSFAIPQLPAGAFENLRVSMGINLIGTVISSVITASQYKSIMEKSITLSNPYKE